MTADRWKHHQGVAPRQGHQDAHAHLRRALVDAQRPPERARGVGPLREREEQEGRLVAGYPPDARRQGRLGPADEAVARAGECGAARHFHWRCATAGGCFSGVAADGCVFFPAVPTCGLVSLGVEQLHLRVLNDGLERRLLPLLLQACSVSQARGGGRREGVTPVGGRGAMENVVVMMRYAGVGEEERLINGQLAIVLIHRGLASGRSATECRGVHRSEVRVRRSEVRVQRSEVRSASDLE